MSETLFHYIDRGTVPGGGGGFMVVLFVKELFFGESVFFFKVSTILQKNSLHVFCMLFKFHRDSHTLDRDSIECITTLCDWLKNQNCPNPPPPPPLPFRKEKCFVSASIGGQRLGSSELKPITDSNSYGVFLTGIQYWSSLCGRVVRQSYG